MENVGFREGDTPKLIQLGHLPSSHCQGQVLRWSKKNRGTLYTVPWGAWGSKLVSGLKDKPGASNGKTCRTEVQVERYWWGVGEQGERIKENCKQDWGGSRDWGSFSLHPFMQCWVTRLEADGALPQTLIFCFKAGHSSSLPCCLWS